METIKPYLDELVEFLKTASPMVWETAVKQVYVTVVQCAIWILFAIALAFCGYKLYQYARREYAKDNYSDWEFGAGGGIVIAGIGTVIFLMLLGDAVSMLINPNYYALKILLKLVGVGAE